jgi:hypothetical protein
VDRPCSLKQEAGNTEGAAASSGLALQPVPISNPARAGGAAVSGVGGEPVHLGHDGHHLPPYRVAVGWYNRVV